MKKFSLLIGLLVVVFAATAYAQPIEFKMSGFIAAGGFWNRNLTTTNDPLYSVAGDIPDPNSGNSDKYATYATTRARLKFQAIAGKELSGTVFFEMDATEWGGYNGTRNSVGFWQADRAGLEIKNVYIDVGVPYFGVPVPMSLRVGVQTLAIRDDVFLYTDGSGITATFNSDPVTANLYWFKALEGKDYASDDADVYGAQAKAALGDMSLGGYLMAYRMNTYPLDRGSTPKYSSYGPEVGNNEANFYWAGFYADGKYAGFNYVLDGIYDWGKVKQHNGIAETADRVKYNGYLGRLHVNYPWEVWDFGGGAYYASGLDAKKTDPTGLPGTNTWYDGTARANDKVGAYVVPPSAEPGFTPSPYSAVWLGNYYWTNNLGLTQNDCYNTVGTDYFGGTWGAFAYAGLKVAPWYKVYLQGMYLGDTTKNGNTVGMARRDDGSLRDDKTIGFEFALTNIFQVYNNLEFDVVAGYLFAGKAWDMYDDTRGKNVSPDDPFQVGWRLKYSF
jgi:hypothetical protein